MCLFPRRFAACVLLPPAVCGQRGSNPQPSGVASVPLKRPMKSFGGLVAPCPGGRVIFWPLRGGAETPPFCFSLLVAGSFSGTLSPQWGLHLRCHRAPRPRRVRTRGGGQQSGSASALLLSPQSFLGGRGAPQRGSPGRADQWMYWRYIPWAVGCTHCVVGAGAPETVQGSLSTISRDICPHAGCFKL